MLFEFFELRLGDKRIAGATLLIVEQMMAKDHRAGCAALHLACDDLVKNALPWKDDAIDAIQAGAIVEHKAVPRSAQETRRDKTFEDRLVARREILTITAFVEGR